METRCYRVCTDIGWLQERHNWKGLGAIVEVCSIIEQHAKTTESRRYYISSLAMTTKAAAYAVCSHWGIENKLHWVLDVVLKEDAAQLRAKNGANNMAVVRQ